MNPEAMPMGDEQEQEQAPEAKGGVTYTGESKMEVDETGAVISEEMKKQDEEFLGGK